MDVKFGLEGASKGEGCIYLGCIQIHLPDAPPLDGTQKDAPSLDAHPGCNVISRIRDISMKIELSQVWLLFELNNPVCKYKVRTQFFCSFYHLFTANSSTATLNTIHKILGEEQLL